MASTSIGISLGLGSSASSLRSRPQKGAASKVQNRESCNEFLRQISYHLIRLDLWTRHTVDNASRTKFRKIVVGLNGIGQLLDPGPMGVTQPYSSLQVRFNSRRDRSVDDFIHLTSEDELLNVMKDTRVSRFYPELVRLCIRMSQTAAILADPNRDLGSPRGRHLGGASLNEHVEELVVNRDGAFHRLKLVVREAELLADAVKAAEASGDMDAASLPPLKEKIDGLLDYYPEACREIGKVPNSSLLSDGGSSPW